MAYNNSMSANVTPPSPQYHRLTRPSSAIHSIFLLPGVGTLGIPPAAYRWARCPPRERCFRPVLLQGAPMVPPAPLPFPSAVSQHKPRSRNPKTADPRSGSTAPAQVDGRHTGTSRHHRSSPCAGTPGYEPPRRQSAMATVGKAGRSDFKRCERHQDGNEPSRPADPFLATSSR